MTATTDRVLRAMAAIVDPARRVAPRPPLPPADGRRYVWSAGQWVRTDDAPLPVLDGAEDLVQRQLAHAVLAGPVITLWSAAGARAALDGARDLLARASPPTVMVHHWPTLPAQAAVAREIARDHHLWIGAGIDAVALAVTAGRWSVSRAVSELVRLARAGVDAGATHLVLDPEGRWEVRDAALHQRLCDTATAALAAIRAACPGLVLGHTSYDQPTLHAHYPWAAWLGPGGVDVALPQVYAAGGGPGSLTHRLAAHHASWQRATALGWIRPGLPVVPYLQAHGVPAGETVVVGQAGCALWASPARIDAEGERALRALCALTADGCVVPGAVARYQAAHGLVADGVCGPRTFAALGIA